mmetsp:Transcript_32353/g.50597  ORF Transcript_32353/g.50597 Transcript_32353/m.50597 type:complete len:83 (-) Transcript_32353:1234-1482(-)
MIKKGEERGKKRGSVHRETSRAEKISPLPMTDFRRVWNEKAKPQQTQQTPLAINIPCPKTQLPSPHQTQSRYCNACLTSSKP